MIPRGWGGGGGGGYCHIKSIVHRNVPPNVAVIFGSRELERGIRIRGNFLRGSIVESSEMKIYLHCVPYVLFDSRISSEKPQNLICIEVQL